MPSNTDYIMQGFQGLGALPGAVSQVKQYDATYGQASPEENQIFEMRKRFVMQGGDGNVFDRILRGEDPSALADEHHASRRPPGGQAPQAPVQQTMPMQGAPSPAPQGPPMMSAQNAPPQPFYGGGGLGAPAQPMQQAAPPPPSNEPLPYEPSGMVDLARGNRMGGGMGDMRPTVSQSAPPPEPRTRDSMARMNGMLNDVENSRLRQSMAIRNTTPRPSKLDPNDPEVLRMKADLKMETDQAKENAYVSGRLAASLESKEKLAAVAKELADRKLGLDEKQWTEKLEYWKSLLKMRDGWERIKQESGGDDRALRLVLGLINAEARAVTAPPFDDPGVQAIKDRVPGNVGAIGRDAAKTLKGQLGGSPTKPASTETTRSSSSVSGPQPSPKPTPKTPKKVLDAADEMGL